MLTFPYFERVPDQSVIAGTNGNRYDRAIATRRKGLFVSIQLFRKPDVC